MDTCIAFELLIRVAWAVFGVYPKLLQAFYERFVDFGQGKHDAAHMRCIGDWSPPQNGREFRRCCCQCACRCICGDEDGGLPISLGPLTEPDRPIDVRDG